MNATDRIMREVESLFALDSDFCGAWAEMLRHTIAHAVVDLERARDAAMAEADDLRAEVDRLRCRHWPETPDDVRALLGSACAAVRYALPVPDGAFEAPPHESDIYTVSAHDLITCNIAASGMRYVSDVALERAQAELAQAREVLRALDHTEGRCPLCGWRGHAPDCKPSAALAAKGE